MGKYETYYADALALFLKGWTLKAISENFNVSEQTLIKWKRDGKWEQKRKDYRETGTGSAEVIRNQISRILSKIEVSETLEPGMADELSKLAKVLKTLEKEDDVLHYTTMVMKKFVEYIKFGHAEKSEELSGVIRGFFDFIERGGK